MENLLSMVKSFKIFGLIVFFACHPKETINLNQNKWISFFNEEYKSFGCEKKYKTTYILDGKKFNRGNILFYESIKDFGLQNCNTSRDTKKSILNIALSNSSEMLVVLNKFEELSKGFYLSDSVVNYLKDNQDVETINLFYRLNSEYTNNEYIIDNEFYSIIAKKEVNLYLNMAKLPNSEELGSPAKPN